MRWQFRLIHRDDRPPTLIEEKFMTVAIAPDTNPNPESPSVLRLGIPKEVAAGEHRVAATPDTAKKLQKLGFEIWIEAGAGTAASFPDEAYQAAGCHIVEDTAALWSESDIILKVRSPQFHSVLNRDETELLRTDGTLISFIWPAQNAALLERLAQKGATVLAMDSVPRITRAQ